ncbi:MAG: CRTAC1 family protein [Pseudomonadota bacterium]
MKIELLNIIFAKATFIKNRQILPGLLGFLCVVLLMVSSSIAFADIKFEEVTRGAGIAHSGATWGASWGDFNGDGWPDLWVGNHNYKPSLYLNQRDGSFIDIIDIVWGANPQADTHGAAWADFDNDGDQDLIELVGAELNEDGTMCIGCGENHLFVNDSRILREAANQLGVSQPVGLGRTPLWFDADRDGRLDVLAINTRLSGKASSIVYRQTPMGFRPFNQQFGFRDSWRSRWEKISDLLNNLLRFRLQWPRDMAAVPHYEFAMLADLSDDGLPDLVVFSRPVRVYSIDKLSFTDITDSLAFPSVSGISDAAIGDYDGDSRLDIYLTVGPIEKSDLVQSSLHELRGAIMGRKRSYRSEDFKAVHFQTRGEVSFSIYPTWLKLSKILIGSTGKNPSERSFSLSPKAPDVRGTVSGNAVESGEVSIHYDPASETWTIRNLTESYFVDFIAKSSHPIDNIRTSGFVPFREEGADVLLMRRGDQFVEGTLSNEVASPTACHSVVSGDFDNDMDEDLYLVCTRQAQNLPNRLYENLGDGNFTVVPGGGGAAGSKLGRGDVAVTADYDHDGFLDLFVSNGKDPDSPFVKDGPHQLFRNLGNSNHWLELDLKGVMSNRDGIGAKVIIEAGGIVQIREQRGGMHRLAQNHQRLHFGLGQHAKVDRLEIHWPSGYIQSIENIRTNQILQIEEEVEISGDRTLKPEN